MAPVTAKAMDSSAVAEDAVAVARRAGETLSTEIAQGCRVHAQYLAEYGSLGDAVLASADAE